MDLPAFWEILPANRQIAGRDKLAPDWIVSQPVWSQRVISGLYK
jgi:hypothetical protein